jgi:nucleotide-binding universal stress UspA family protein
MTHSEFKFGILVGVDGSPESDAAVRWATAEAILRREAITLLHVVAPLVLNWPVIPVATGMTSWELENAHHVLDTATKTVQAAAGGGHEPPEVRTQLRHAAVAWTITDWSRNAVMTVVGCRRIGTIRRVLEGSVSGHVVRHASGPVVIVHADETRSADPSSPVLVGVDGSAASEDATVWAFDEASRRGVDVVALHAWSDSKVQTMFGIDWAQYEAEGHRVLAERLAGWQKHYPDVGVKHRIVVDDPADRLIDASRQSQLVVVGGRGRGGFTDAVLGSVAAKVSAGAAAPTVVVRPR